MTLLVNSIALIILAITMIFFFETKYLLTKASHYYRICLILTLITGLVNTFQIEALEHLSLSYWAMEICVTLDYAMILFTTTVLALYLICKICEHVYSISRLYVAHTALFALTVVYVIILILNIPFGFIFNATKDGEIVSGVASALPYFFIIPQALTVMAYSIVFREHLTRSVKNAFLESIVAVALCITLKFLFKDVLVFGFVMVLIELIFFLNFQNFRTGVNSLTNLNGARGFSKEFNRRVRKGKDVRVYLIKLRNITAIKHNFGQRAGDEILYLFAFGLEKLFDDQATFHLYGNTFSVILPTTTAEEDKKDTDTLIEYLEGDVEYKGNSIKLEYTLSESVRSDGEIFDDFYERMEHSCEVAKDEHLRYIKCTPALDAARIRRNYLIKRMQHITADAGFELWFQPIYRVAAEAYTNMEALIRMKAEDGSYISPAEFIPIAENTGQIIEITEFVIEETCRVLSEYAELSTMKVSINLPMIQLTDPAFEKKLDDIVDRYGISHDRICFEFTERVILDDLTVAEKNMRRLTRSGYTFFLDDFGVGYSNFNCVLRLPIKTVKLDMSLTSTTRRLSENYGIVNVLTALFHDMGLTVVAEGAETKAQVKLLQEYGVDGIQGYYFAKPMPLDKLISFLQSQAASVV